MFFKINFHFQILNTKKQTLSSQDIFSTSRGRRTRKAPASVQEASRGPNPKRRRLIESLELEEDDVREARPERKSAKHANHNESDSDFDDFEERTKRTMSNRKSQFSRLAQNDNRKERARMGIKVTFTDEQTQLLLAVFPENHYPSLDQQGSGRR